MQISSKKQLTGGKIFFVINDTLTGIPTGNTYRPLDDGRRTGQEEYKIYKLQNSYIIG